MSSTDIANLENDLQDYDAQLKDTSEKLETNPESKSLLALKSQLEEAIALLQEELDNAKAVDPPKQPSPQPESPKWSKDTHPAFQPGYRRPGAPSKPTDDTTTSPSYKVNDRVLARWISGDKAFHPARITSVTGSSADPVYIVTFKGYSDSENLRGQDLKPITNKPYSNENKKRVADEPPAPVVSTPPKPATKPSVISGEAIINPDFVDQARKEPSKVGDGPQRPAKAQRKVKANKELEAGKNKWQEFTSKGKFGKAAKKESMFRTGEGVNARVGFTGSGHGMRKDPVRSKHVYQPNEEET